MLLETDPQVSVIIVNYNGQNFMESCLNSIHENIRKFRYEIIVVDNQSTDGSREWLARRTDIVYVAAKENLGFTGGNNFGATHAKGSILFFINNDTLVQSALDPMFESLSDENIGLLGCRLVYGDGRQQFSFGYDHTPIRIVLSWLGVEKRPTLPKLFRRVETHAPLYLSVQKNVEWVSGACFVMRATDWHRLQGFDTQFFMYCEDVDLCLRVRELGKEVRYIPDVIVTHYEGAGRVWIGKAALMRTVNSYMLFCRKHYGRVQSRLMSLCLGSIFMMRASAFWLQSLFPRVPQTVLSDKAGAYRAAGLYLLGNKPVASTKGAQ